jgi:DNA-binding XRE family transcriptional regulator
MKMFTKENSIVTNVTPWRCVTFVNKNFDMTERIKQLIETLGFSQMQFADQIGVNRTVVNHIINGRNKVSLEVATRILSTFRQVSPDWLLSGTGAMLRGETLPEAQVPPAEVKKVHHITIYYTDNTYSNYYPRSEEAAELGKLP